MGGRSSSSTAQSNESRNYDQRIAATDNAVVASHGGTVYALDGGAIEGSFEFAGGALDLLKEWGDTLRDGSAQAMAAVNATATRAFDFVEEARKEADERNFQKALPWLVLGVAVVAMMGAGK